jgi:hypothetical protein
MSAIEHAMQVFATFIERAKQVLRGRAASSHEALDEDAQSILELEIASPSELPSDYNDGPFGQEDVRMSLGRPRSITGAKIAVATSSDRSRA